MVLSNYYTTNPPEREIKSFLSTQGLFKKTPFNRLELACSVYLGKVKQCFVSLWSSDGTLVIVTVGVKIDFFVFPV